MIHLDTVHVKVKVKGQSSWSQDQNVAKVLGAISDEGFSNNLSVHDDGPWIDEGWLCEWISRYHGCGNEY